MTNSRQFYAVTANLPEAVVEKYVLWLQQSHLPQMMLSGALDARIVLYPALADSTRDVETQYLFQDEAAFHIYEERHAPELRAEGMRLFGSMPGVRFSRRLGLLRSWQ